MKTKLTQTLPIYFVLLSLFVFNVFSATLSLTKIGALNTDGKTYSEWWYTGSNPMLMGTATASSEVSIKINDDTYTTTADGSGNWSYTPTAGAGDYSVVISQGEESYSFTLHLGQNFPGALESTETTSTVPDTGFNQVVAATFGVGIALLATYFYIWGDSDKRVKFEKRYIKEE